MKRVVSWMVVAFILSVSAILGMHWKQVRKMQENLVQTETRWEKEELANSLVLALEKYRRKSTSFRKLTDAELAGVKNHLKTDLLDGLTKLESSNPSPDEKAVIDQVRNQFAEFQVLSVKFEPMLFTKDVYQKPQIQELHDAMIAGLSKIGKNAKSESAMIRSETDRAARSTLHFLIMATTVSVILVALIILRNFWVHVKPMRLLKHRARDIRKGIVKPSDGLLRGSYAEVEKLMSEMAHVIDVQRSERQNFVTAVATDLRAPITILQSGAKQLRVIGSQNPDPQRFEALKVIDRSLFRLSRTLDDLDDIVDTTDHAIHLNEKIVDLRDVLSQTSQILSGPGSRYEVSVSVPNAAVWGSIDPQRFERVLINLMSKMMNLQPQGGRIDVSMTDPSQVASSAGAEIIIQDALMAEKRPGMNAGPEQDLLKHWVAQSGFGMSLAYRIMRAHGGSITASGVAGTGVAFTLRLPKSRVAFEFSSGLRGAPQTLASAESRSEGKVLE